MLFPTLLPLAAVAWMAAGSAEAAAQLPPTLPSTAIDAAATAVAEVAPTPDADKVAVVLFDENHPETRTLFIGRDGSVDEATRHELEHLFRCKRTDHSRAIEQGLLAKLADVASQYPGKTIEFVSAYRAKERHTSRHYQGRALDFRIKGVPILDVRDYVWTNHKNVGVGWYPKDGFIHMDHREDDADIAWTSNAGGNQYHPIWSKRARRGEQRKARESRVGL